MKASPPALPRREGAFSHRWGEKAWLMVLVYNLWCAHCLVFVFPLNWSNAVRAMSASPSPWERRGRGLPLFSLQSYEIRVPSLSASATYDRLQKQTF